MKKNVESLPKEFEEDVIATLHSTLPYAVVARLRFIECMLVHFNQANRQPIADYFGVTQQSASADLQLYIKLAPLNMKYNLSTRTYERTPEFVRLWR